MTVADAVTLGVASDSIGGIIERIEIDGTALGVLGETCGALDVAVTVGRGVIGAHVLLVVARVSVRQLDMLYRIALTVELAKDVGHVGGDIAMHHHLALQLPALGIVMEHRDIAQLIPGDSTDGTMNRHTGFHRGGNLRGDEGGLGLCPLGRQKGYRDKRYEDSFHDQFF